MSSLLMKILIVIYFVTGVFSLAEQNYARALYWLGAILLMASVLWATE